MAHSSIFAQRFLRRAECWEASKYQRVNPSPDSQKKNRFLVSTPVRWVGQAPFLSKDGESRQMVLSEDFGRWLLATCRSWLLITICLSASLTWTKRSWFCSSPVLRSESNLRNRVAQELGSIRNVVKIYLGLLAAEHECRVAAALAPFDFAWWQSQFSDESPGLMLSVLLRLASGFGRLFFLHSSLGAFTGTSKTQPTDVWRVPQIQFFRLPNKLIDSKLPTPRIIGPSNKLGFDFA